MEQGEQLFCQLGHHYKATTERTLLGDAELKWPGAARLSTDLGTGLMGFIFQQGPCQVASASPCLRKHKCGTGTSLLTRGVLGGPDCKGMDTNSKMPTVGTLVPAPAARFKLSKSQRYPLPHISEQKFIVTSRSSLEMALAALMLPGAKRSY